MPLRIILHTGNILTIKRCAPSCVKAFTSLLHWHPIKLSADEEIIISFKVRKKSEKISDDFWLRTLLDSRSKELSSMFVLLYIATYNNIHISKHKCFWDKGIEGSCKDNQFYWFLNKKKKEKRRNYRTFRCPLIL